MALGDNGSLILYDNVVEDSTLTSSSTGSGAINNLKDLKLYTIWQASGSGNHDITIDRGTNKTVNAIGIIGHNLNTKSVTGLVLQQSLVRPAGLIAGAYVSGRGTIYIHSGVSNFVVTSFQSPNLWPMGLAFDAANNQLISCDNGSDKIYIHSGLTSTITNSFVSPANDPIGLAFDTINNRLISCDRTTDKIYVHSGITTTITDSWATTDPTALTYANGDIISGSRTTDKIYIHSGISSTITNSFNTPETWVYGLAYDGTNLYSSDWGTNKIYVHSGISSVITDSFNAGDLSTETNGGGGLTFDSTAQDVERWNNIFSALTPSNDKIIFKSFSESTESKWKLAFTSGVADPKIGVLTIGQALEMTKYPIKGYSPDSQKSMMVKRSAQVGNFLENIVDFTNRELKPSYKNLTTNFVTGNFKTFWDSHGKYGKPFIFAWNYDKYPDDVFWVVIKDGYRLTIPYNPTLRNLILNLIGLVE